MSHHETVNHRSVPARMEVQASLDGRIKNVSLVHVRNFESPVGDQHRVQILSSAGELLTEASGGDLDDAINNALDCSSRLASLASLRMCACCHFSRWNPYVGGDGPYCYRNDPNYPATTPSKYYSPATAIRTEPGAVCDRFVPMNFARTLNR